MWWVCGRVKALGRVDKVEKEAVEVNAVGCLFKRINSEVKGTVLTWVRAYLCSRLTCSSSFRQAG